MRLHWSSPSTAPPPVGPNATSLGTPSPVSSLPQSRNNITSSWRSPISLNYSRSTLGQLVAWIEVSRKNARRVTGVRGGGGERLAAVDRWWIDLIMRRAGRSGIDLGVRGGTLISLRRFGSVVWRLECPLRLGCLIYWFWVSEWVPTGSRVSWRPSPVSWASACSNLLLTLSPLVH